MLGYSSAKPCIHMIFFFYFVVNIYSVLDYKIWIKWSDLLYLFFFLETHHHFTKKKKLPDLHHTLLTNKARKAYEKLLAFIKEVSPEFRSSSVSVDYEQAAIGTVREPFPQTQVHRCLFG